MSRDHTKLRVFIASDALVAEIYALTRLLPSEERHGLMSQLRRPAVSVPTNIVEGAVRHSDKHYVQFLETSLGSACETRYLVGLCASLKLIDAARCEEISRRYDEVVRGLAALIRSIHQELPVARQLDRPKADC